jgi:energy-coupling factor transporter ATP-binding protein EcfA2
MLIATHNIDWVLGVADRIITLKNGQIDLDLDLKVMSKEDAGNLITGSS